MAILCSNGRDVGAEEVAFYHDRSDGEGEEKEVVTATHHTFHIGAERIQR